MIKGIDSLGKVTAANSQTNHMGQAALNQRTAVSSIVLPLDLAKS